jgi:hypothetical protein
MSKKLYEDIKNFLIENQKGGQTIGQPSMTDMMSQHFTDTNGKPKPVKLPINVNRKPQNTGSGFTLPHDLPRKDSIRKFSAHITPTGNKVSTANMEYASHVHDAASKFKNDDEAISHLHKLANHASDLTDEKKNEYKQHINHMRGLKKLEQHIK